MLPMTRNLIAEALSAPPPVVPLVYHFVSFDTDCEATERTSNLGPLDVLAELHMCEGLTDEAAFEVFRVLAAPGSVLVPMPGGWAFQLTSEVDHG